MYITIKMINQVTIMLIKLDSFKQLFNFHYFLNYEKKFYLYL